LLYSGFGAMSGREFERLLRYFYRWCTKDQVWKTIWYHDYALVYTEMGCSAGVRPIDAANEFVNMLKRNNFPIKEMSYWSLHPDASVKVLRSD
jgi:hypothetical protein